MEDDCGQKMLVDKEESSWPSDLTLRQSVAVVVVREREIQYLYVSVRRVVIVNARMALESLRRTIVHGLFFLLACRRHLSLEESLMNCLGIPFRSKSEMH